MKVIILDDIKVTKNKQNTEDYNRNNRSEQKKSFSGFQYSVEVYGLQIQGGRIDMRSKLLVDELPTIQNRPMPTMKWQIIPNYQPPSGSYYSCPLYRTGMRSGVLNTCGQSLNHVRNINLMTNEPSSKWILRGTALFCELMEY